MAISVADVNYLMRRGLLVSQEVVAAHEISHLFGVRDHFHLGQPCIMSVHTTSTVQWCYPCQTAMLLFVQGGIPFRGAEEEWGSYISSSFTPPPRLVFSSLDELMSSHTAVRASRSIGNYAELTASTNFASLERLYLPTNIPEKYELLSIAVTEWMVSIIYLHRDDMVTEDTIGDALINRRGFSFNITRLDLDSPMDGIMLQNHATEDDLIEGRYLFVEPNLFVWTTDSEVITMYTPLQQHDSDRALNEVRNNAEWAMQPQLFATDVLNLLDESEDVSRFSR